MGYNFLPIFRTGAISLLVFLLANILLVLYFGCRDPHFNVRKTGFIQCEAGSCHRGFSNYDSGLANASWIWARPGLNAAQLDCAKQILQTAGFDSPDGNFVVESRGVFFMMIHEPPAPPYDTLLWCSAAKDFQSFEFRLANKDGRGPVEITITRKGVINGTNSRFLEVRRTSDSNFALLYVEQVKTWLSSNAGTLIVLTIILFIVYLAWSAQRGPQ